MTSSHVCGLDVSGGLVFTIYNRKSVSKENAGVIDAVGEDVVGWAVGDAVLYHGSAFYNLTTVLW